MMDRLIEIVAHTPLWVWPLLAALLWLGWQASQTRVVPLWRLVILPAAILIMSIVTLLSFGPNGVGISIWVGGVLIGGALGWFSYRSDGLAVDHEHRLLRLPGEWKSLGLIAVIFAFRYYWGYKSATAPELVAIPTATISYIGFNGMLSGIFIGWRLRGFHLYRSAPSQDLT